MELYMSEKDMVFSPIPVSITDGAYQQAKLHGTTKSIIASLMDMIPGLGFSDDAINDEVKVELRKGYATRWHEENPSTYYVAVDGNWVKCESEEKMLSHKKADKFVLDVHTAFGYTQQAFGALKNEEPLKHSLIKETRDKFNKYVSNRVGDLNREAKKLYRERNGIENTRSSVPLFYVWLTAPEKGILSQIRQRCINAKAKGDETADLAKLDKALASFKTSLDK
jgi:hypothetical protein